MTPLEFSTNFKGDHNFLVINHYKISKSVTIRGFYQKAHAEENTNENTVTILEL